MTYEDFIHFYKDEIDGKLNRRQVIAAKREPQADEVEEEKEGEEEDHDKEKIAREADHDDGEGDNEHDKAAEAEKAKEAAKKAEEDKQRKEELREQEILHRNEMRQDFYNELFERKYSLDEKLFRTVLNKLEVSKFGNDYILAVHPEPPMQDVLMLFQFDPELVEEETIIYKDYGLAERLPLTEVPEDLQTYVDQENMKIKTQPSPLKSKEIDILSPLLPIEWKLWYDIITATKGHGFLQILPVGYRSSQAFKNNLMQILPKKDKEWKTFHPPIDTMISLREDLYKKENKRIFNENQKRMERLEKLKKDPVADEERKRLEEEQKEADVKNEPIYKFSKHNIFTLPEYDFPHCVCILDSEPSDNSLVTDYMKICEELGLAEHKNLGVTILLNEKWMFVATLSKPYMKMENGLDLFVDAFSYGGIMNIHIKKHGWPQTASIDVEDNKHLSLLENILDYLPSREHSEPEVVQQQEEEQPLEEEDKETEGEGKEEEGEGEREDESKDS